MPQGRRKTPFSGKAKKEQLKSKRQTKQPFQSHSSRALLTHRSDDDDDEGPATRVQKLNYQSAKGGKSMSNRYGLQFHRETDAEMRERKELARHSLEPASEKDFEISVEEHFPPQVDFPRRPTWSYDESRVTLDAKENRYFNEYVSKLEKEFGPKELSYFEMNLETWRQLWRVLEMSDIVLIIVDIRFPALMFPPSLYQYVTGTLKKNMIVVLNKIDLAPAPLVAAWKNYFKEKYPELHVLMFTTLPGYNLIGKQSDKAGLQVRRRRGKIRMAAEGTELLFNACKDIVGDNLSLSSWQQKIKEEMANEYVDDDDEIEIGEVIDVKNVDLGYFEHERYKSGILTIGCLGQPNVGKSSLINAIMGKKVVSVSKTPGHTKHFQTIFLTQNVRLCDCPGLVFPSKVPKTLQILMGSFPIAQLREPYTTIKYLGEHLPLPKLLRIDHPEGDDEWSAMDICEGWAKKRGYLTAKAARPDTYRAANSILRMALDGKICICLCPPEYHSLKKTWASHPDVKLVKHIQARSNEDEDGDAKVADENLFSDDDEIKPIAKVIKKAAGSRSGDTSESESDEEEEDDDEAVSVAPNKFAALEDDA